MEGFAVFLDFLLGKKKTAPAPVPVESVPARALPAAGLGIDAEASALWEERAAVADEIKRIGPENFSNALQVREEALELAAELEEIAERKVEVQHSAVATKMKFARKAQSRAKELPRFAARIVSLFDAGKLREEDGKVFGQAYNLLQSGKVAEARAEIGKLAALARMEERRQRSESAIDAFRQRLAVKRAGLDRALEKIAAYEEFGPVDDGAAKQYETIRQRMGEYDRWRVVHIERLKNRPLSLLADNVELGPAGFPALPSELAEFVKSEPALARLSAPALLELSGQSEARLAHSLAPAAKFRRLVREHEGALMKIRDLEKTGFLSASVPAMGADASPPTVSMVATTPSATALHDYALRHDAPAPTAGIPLELAKLGHDGFARIREQSERQEKMAELRKTAKPWEKEGLAARKTEIERALKRLE